MKYIVLDSYISGTGVKDSLSSEFLEIEILHLSSNLKCAIKKWKTEYFEAIISNQRLLNKQIFYHLDLEGIKLSKLILKENSSYKIDYYYSDFLESRIYPNRWEEYKMRSDYSN